MVTGGLLGIFERLTSLEVLTLLMLALIVLGPERLPEVARSVGRMIAKAKTMTSGVTSEFREVLDDPDLKPLREVSEFVASPRRKLLEYATEAENEAEEARRLARAAAAAAEAAEAAAAEARAQAEDALEAADAAEVAADEAAEAAQEVADDAAELENAAELDATVEERP